LGCQSRRFCFRRIGPIRRQYAEGGLLAAWLAIPAKISFEDCGIVW